MSVLTLLQPRLAHALRGAVQYHGTRLPIGGGTSDTCAPPLSIIVTAPRLSSTRQAAAPRCPTNCWARNCAPRRKSLGDSGRVSACALAGTQPHTRRYGDALRGRALLLLDPHDKADGGVARAPQTLGEHALMEWDDRGQSVGSGIGADKRDATIASAILALTVLPHGRVVSGGLVKSSQLLARKENPAQPRA